MSRILLPVPHIRQRAPGHCLAACAAMVLSHLGLSISYGRLLKLLQIKPRFGSLFFAQNDEL